MTTPHRPDTSAAAHGVPVALRREVCLIGRDGPVTASVGRRLARLLGVEVADAHLLHPAGREHAAGSVGTHIHDRPPVHDRLQWLSEIGRTVASSSTGVVVVCPPISRSSRDIIRWEAPATLFVRLASASDEPSTDVLDFRIVPEDGWDAIADRIARLLTSATTPAASTEPIAAR